MYDVSLLQEIYCIEAFPPTIVRAVEATVNYCFKSVAVNLIKCSSQSKKGMSYIILGAGIAQSV
jgi:hypothetical protein